MKILNRYLIREYIPKFITSLLLFTFILLMDQLFDLMDLMLNKKVGLENISKLFAYVMPSLLMFSLPMSILAATVLLYVRLSEDNEITAIRTSGGTTWTLLKPIIAVSIILSLMMVYFNSTVAPAANQKFKTLYYQILYKNPLMQLSEKSFLQFQNYNIYIKKIESGNVLKGVVIYKWGSKLPLVTAAERAELTVAEEKGLIFRLHDGMTFFENPDKQGELDRSSFSENEMIIAINSNTDFLSSRESSLREIKSPDLLKKAKALPERRYVYLTEYHLRMAIACAPVIFVFIAAPLAIFNRRKAKGYGLTATVAIIFAYYILLVAGSAMSEKHVLEPAIALWMPNIILGAAGVFFTARMSKK